jgi:hypothetical protein
MKRLAIFIAGTLLFVPIVVALCCDSLVFASFALVYALVMWNSPKFSPRLRKFWLEFWKINIRFSSTMRVR